MSQETDEKILTVLKDIAGVSKVGGGPVPLPNALGEMKDHLFANLTLGSFVQDEDMGGLADQLRAIALDAFQRLRGEHEVTGYATICVSLFTPISATEGLRIYRTRLNTTDLPRLDRENFTKLVTGEESGKRELNELLHAVR
jgi:hypothetical protein